MGVEVPAPARFGRHCRWDRMRSVDLIVPSHLAVPAFPGGRSRHQLVQRTASKTQRWSIPEPDSTMLFSVFCRRHGADRLGDAWCERRCRAGRACWERPQHWMWKNSASLGHLHIRAARRFDLALVVSVCSYRYVFARHVVGRSGAIPFGPSGVGAKVARDVGPVS